LLTGTIILYIVIVDVNLAGVILLTVGNR